MGKKNINPKSEIAEIHDFQVFCCVFGGLLSIWQELNKNVAKQPSQAPKSTCIPPIKHSGGNILTIICLKPFKNWPLKYFLENENTSHTVFIYNVFNSIWPQFELNLSSIRAHLIAMSI
jgi:hypothetical protein